VLTNAKSVTIVLDAGHGGSDPGARGPGGLKESAVNLSVVLKLKQLLEKAGARVYLTRSGNYYVSLKQRAAIANKVGATRYISIHHNSASSSLVNGTETFISRRASRTAYDLAYKVQKSLVGVLKKTNRGVKRAGFYVITYSRMPAILIEPSFISNPAQAAQLRSPAYQAREAAAIFAGLRDHMRLSRSYDKLGIEGSSLESTSLYFPHVIDKKSVWRSYISLTSSQQCEATLNFYNSSGNLINQSLRAVEANKRYTYYPKDLIGRDFDGSVVITSTKPLVGNLRLSNRNCLGTMTSQVPSSSISFAHVVDIKRKHTSIVSINNTGDTDTLTTIKLYKNNGVLVKEKTISLSPHRRYSFYPRKLSGKNFDGNIIIQANTSSITGYLGQYNINRKGFGMIGNPSSANDVYFPNVSDGRVWNSFVSIRNQSNALNPISIDFYNNANTLIISKQKSIPVNGAYSFYPRRLTKLSFDGFIVVRGNDLISACMGQTYAKKSSLGLVEAGTSSNQLNFTDLRDGAGWIGLTSIINTDTTAVSIDNSFYNSDGSLFKNYSYNLAPLLRYGISPFANFGSSFSGSAKITNPNSAILGTYSQSN